MKPLIARWVVDAVLAEAAAAPGQEACGLLLGRNGQIEAHLPTRNIATDPRTAFEVDPAALLAAHRAARAGGPAVLGHYHSHPHGRAEPSEADARAATWDGTLWLIAAAGHARLFRAAAEGHFVEQPLAAG